jgi:hypothetical protein
MSPIVKQVFAKWVKMPTWYTGHALDEERFYGFVWAAARYCRKEISEEELKELIIDEQSAIYAPLKMVSIFINKCGSRRLRARLLRKWFPFSIPRDEHGSTLPKEECESVQARFLRNCN